MNPIAARRLSLSLPMGRRRRHVPKDQSTGITAEATIQPTSPQVGNLGVSFPRRETLHQFKYMGRRQANPQARLQKSGRHDKGEVSSKEPFFSLPWIVVHPLPHNGFRYSFTFSPKCFSSFAHATCALSVFSRYLALAEVYLPFALHSQAVLLRKSKGVVSALVGKRGYHPLGHSIPGRLFQRAEIQ